MKGLLYKDFIHLRKFLLAGLFLIVFSLVGVWIFLNRLGEKDFAYGFIVSISTHWFTFDNSLFCFSEGRTEQMECLCTVVSGGQKTAGAQSVPVSVLYSPYGQPAGFLSLDFPMVLLRKYFSSTAG